jgi:uncharacterized repeat protein (TIGR02059 family)
MDATNGITNSYNNIMFSYNILEKCGWQVGNTDKFIVRITNDGSSPFNNISFYNNVITGDNVTAMIGFLIKPSGTINNLNIKNNIVKYCNYQSWLDVQNSGTINGLHADNNILYNNINNNDPSFSGNSVSNYTFLNDIKTDPLFVSSTNFHLQSGSPAIGKGLAITSLTTDYSGTALANPPSIGAYESGSAVSTSVVPVYHSSAIANTTPSILEMTYNLTLANIVPAASAFSVLVNSAARSVSAVVISGTKVQLTLSTRVLPGDVVTVSYVKPANNPLETNSGGIASSIAAQPVNNNCINVAPTAVITSPVINSSFTSPANVSITANAIDNDGSVSLVEFYNGNTKLGSSSSAPYSFTWNNVTDGNYSLTVIATDNLSAKTTSSAISIAVINNIPAPNKHPLVKILNPHKGNAYSNLSSVEIDATASDPDGTISKVEFYNGKVKLVELTSAPYTYIWKDVTAGNYSITAVATDNLNDTTLSSPVEFVVGAITKYDGNSDVVKLFPNPNNGHFSIEFINPLQSEKNEIIITDMAGKQVYDGSVLKEDIAKQFDLSNSKSGLYVMMIKDKEILVTKKFIIK